MELQTTTHAGVSGAEIDPCGRGDPHRVLGVGVEVEDSVARTGIGYGDGAGGVVVHATGLPLHEVAVGPGDRIPGHVQAPNAGLDTHPEDLTRRCLTGRRRRRALCRGLLRGPRDQDEDRDGPKRDREASAARRTGPGAGGPAIHAPLKLGILPNGARLVFRLRRCGKGLLHQPSPTIVATANSRTFRSPTRILPDIRRGDTLPPRNCPHGSGMCAVHKYLKHTGRMDPSYPVHVQRRHARDRLIHSIHKILRCCGGRFRRGGAKSANQTREPPRNRGVGPSPWGRKYLDPRSLLSISRACEQRPGIAKAGGYGAMWTAARTRGGTGSRTSAWGRSRRVVAGRRGGAHRDAVPGALHGVERPALLPPRASGRGNLHLGEEHPSGHRVGGQGQGPAHDLRFRPSPLRAGAVRRRRRTSPHPPHPCARWVRSCRSRSPPFPPGPARTRTAG